MNVRDLVPWARTDNGGRNLPSGQDPVGGLPFTLHREMDRLFDEVFRRFDTPAIWSGRGAWPQLEVRESEREYKVTAELPGLEEADVEVLFEDGVLTLRGEKRAETEDRSRAFSERIYGRFERRLSLGDIDEDRIQASFRNGVLTITAPKSEDSQSRTRRIPINAGTTSH